MALSLSYSSVISSPSAIFLLFASFLSLSLRAYLITRLRTIPCLPLSIVCMILMAKSLLDFSGNNYSS